MATQKDFNAEEWRSITTAPVAAGLLITLSDKSGPIGVAKEAMALAEAIQVSASSSSSEIVRSISQWAKETGRLDPPADLPRDAAAIKAQLLNRIQNGVRTVEAKAPEETGQFKRFVMEVARKTAGASKEGGFLGFGGVEVSEDEKKALEELSSTIGATA